MVSVRLDKKDYIFDDEKKEVIYLYIGEKCVGSLCLNEYQKKMLFPESHDLLLSWKREENGSLPYNLTMNWNCECHKYGYMSEEYY
jgi:hypothetical protein